jgi:hypothetical protein
MMHASSSTTRGGRHRRTFSIFERMLDNERTARCELRLREGS